MLKIRLQKIGKKNQPSYRVVLVEHTAPPRGKFIEILGSYNRRLKQKEFKKERIQYWIAKGAQVSATVHNLLIDAKIIEGKKVKAWGPKKRMEAPAPAEATADKKSSDLSADLSAEVSTKAEAQAKAEIPETESPSAPEGATEDKGVDTEPKIE